MKRKLIVFFLLLALALSACSQPNPATCAHADTDDNGICDRCSVSVIVTVDFYAINDLHGKIVDGDNHPGVDELTTYLKAAHIADEHVVLLSAGDMWQGSSESNLTSGFLTTEWMNDLDFAAMALGNHEFDWGENPIEANHAIAEFPFLAINIYETSTHQPVPYCQGSVMVETGNVQIGIIGAIGDCYSSISSDKTQDVYFLVGDQLTELVKAESQSLREQGADFIVYLLHDGLGKSYSTHSKVQSNQLASYYDTELSDGYVDLVFEGHTHQSYLISDVYGVYHLQNKGENRGGISHAQVKINSVTGTTDVSTAGLIGTDVYDDFADDPIIEDLLDKYNEQIAPSREVLGNNSYKRSSNHLKQLVADLYYQAGIAQWGDAYDIALGGGYMSVRSPYDLNAGQVTYGQLQMLLPFDNSIVLCSIKGSDLKNKFFESNNSNYFICYGQYGAELKNNIDPNATYYIVTDTYTSQYAPNRLTEVARLDDTTFARDLVAQYVRSGGLQ